MDDDWNFIIFEYAMNYSLDGLRYAYAKQKKKAGSKVNAEKLRQLGYSEEQIQKSNL